MAHKKKDSASSQARLLRTGAAVGAGAGLAAQATAQAVAGRIRFDRVADVVVVGAGAFGLPATIMARDRDATVIVVDAERRKSPIGRRHCPAKETESRTQPIWFIRTTIAIPPSLGLLAAANPRLRGGLAYR